MTSAHCNIVFTCLLPPLIGSASLAAEFIDFGRDTWVRAVSDDGTVLAGSSGPGSADWRWTRNDGQMPLTPLQQGDEFSSSSSVRAVSADGSVIVGKSWFSDDAWEPSLATAWTEDGAALSLGSGWEFSEVSGDGTTVAGYERIPPSFHNFGVRMAIGGDPELLDPLPGYSYVFVGTWGGHGISYDGSVVVGDSENADGPSSPGGASEATAGYSSEATVWRTKNGVTEAIGLGRPDGENTWAKLITPDGTTVVGGIGGSCKSCAFTNEHTEPFRFRLDDPAAELEPLGLLNGNPTVGTAVSYDASVIVGQSNGNGQNFVWDEFHGMRDLKDVLRENHGIDDLARFTGGVNIGTMSTDTRVLGGRAWRGGRQTGWAILLDKPLVWIPGDVDRDFDVDFDDFVVLSTNFGQPGGWEDGDFDFNGTIDFADFLELSVAFGTQPPANAVPEPCTVTLWGTALAALLALRGCRPRR